MPCGGITVCCAASDWPGTDENAARPSKPFKPSRRLIFTSRTLLADHQNRKRSRYWGALRRAASAPRGCGRPATFLAHREEGGGFRIEHDRSGAVHPVKILLDFE